MTLTRAVAERIAARMRRDGFESCTTLDVETVFVKGELVDGQEGLASRILNEFDEYGIEVPDA